MGYNGFVRNENSRLLDLEEAREETGEDLECGRLGEGRLLVE